MIFQRERVYGLADSIARAVTTNDLDWLKNLLPRIMSVTSADVQRVAKTYLDPEQRVVVWSVPEEKKSGGASGSPASPPPVQKAAHRSGARPVGGAADGFSLKNAKRVELPNGLTLLLFENH